jgi:universal stress protein E
VIAVKRFRQVTIGVDITAEGEIAPGCRSAVSQGVWLARELEASVTLIHVMDLSADVYAVRSVQPQTSLTQRLLALEKALEGLAAEFPARSVETKVLAGTEWRELVAEARATRDGVVVVGSRRRGVVGRALFGSTADALLRHCPTPVWVVKQPETVRYANVLVAHDLSQIGGDALRLGAEIAAACRAGLHVLHVQERSPDRRLLGAQPSATSRRRSAEVRNWLEEECRKLGTSAVVSITDGAPHAAILDYINNRAIDLVCMGSVARRGLAAFVPGNTAERVLPWIGCSLIAVKPRGFGTTRDASDTLIGPHEATVSRSVRGVLPDL